jgi:cytochrome c-type biogenesis protein CcmH
MVRRSDGVTAASSGHDERMNRSRGRTWVLTLGLVLLFAGIGMGDAPVSFQEMEESLVCQCGCGMTVHSCNHLQCPSAIPLREEIRGQMDAGKSSAAILAYFSDKYGEKILSAPTTVGFNLIAWVAPFIVVGVGGVFLAITVKRWSARARTAPQATPSVPPPASPYDKVLEKELRDFDA